MIKITVGVYSKVDFREDDLILKDQMLVGAQHSSNKVLDYVDMFPPNPPFGDFLCSDFFFWVYFFVARGRLIVWCVVSASNLLVQ